MGNVPNKQMIKIIVVLSILLIFSPLPSRAKDECRWVNVRPGLYCSTEMGDSRWQPAQPYECANNSNNPDNYQCCCGPHIKEKVSISPKIILIASVTTFFAILTGLVYFYKKNE
jgi:hypothetical protein